MACLLSKEKKSAILRFSEREQSQKPSGVCLHARIIYTGSRGTKMRPDVPKGYPHNIQPSSSGDSKAVQCPKFPEGR